MLRLEEIGVWIDHRCCFLGQFDWGLYQGGGEVKVDDNVL